MGKDPTRQILEFQGHLVRLEGFEPPTLGSVDRCSNPLSYSRVGTGSPC